VKFVDGEKFGKLFKSFLVNQRFTRLGSDTFLNK